MDVANDFPWIPHAHANGGDDGDVEYDPSQLQLLLLIFNLPPNKHLEKSQSQPQLQQCTQTPNDCNFSIQQIHSPNSNYTPSLSINPFTPQCKCKKPSIFFF
jgi:hypothetical protein